MHTKRCENYSFIQTATMFILSHMINQINIQYSRKSYVVEYTIWQIKAAKNQEFKYTISTLIRTA